MQLRRWISSRWLALAVGTGLLTLSQQVALAGGPGCPPAPCPFPQIAPQTIQPPIAPMPQAPAPQPGQPAPQPGQPAPQAPAPEAQPPSTDLSLDQRFAGLGGESVSVPNMIGDQVPVSSSFSSSTSSSSSRVNNAAAARGALVKIADNQNALPQDRIFIDFNYFNDVNRSIIRREHLDIGKIDIYAYTAGFEKTLLDGNASVGLRVPLYRVNADNGITPGSGGDFQDIGDLTFFGKYILLGDRQGGLLTAGLAVTVPTGPHNLGGAPDTIIEGIHDTLIQPFIGYRYLMGDWYVQGFESVLIPTDSNDTVLLSTDVGIGYFLMRNRGEGSLLTAIVPTVEAHLNDPLSHRGAFNNFGVPDWVDLTQGVILEFNKRSLLTLGVGEAVTGPRPYAIEGIVQFNFLF